MGVCPCIGQLLLCQWPGPPRADLNQIVRLRCLPALSMRSCSHCNNIQDWKVSDWQGAHLLALVESFA